MHKHTLKNKKSVSLALKKAKLLCAQSGKRLTNLRICVLELILRCDQPVKAYDLLAKLQEQKSSAKPTTIYRTLDFLISLGLVHKIHTLNAYISCLHPEAKNPCLFLICRKCCSVTETPDNVYKEVISQVCQTHAFKTTTSAFEIEGLCQKLCLIKIF